MRKINNCNAKIDLRTFYLVKVLNLESFLKCVSFKYLRFWPKFLLCANSSVGRASDFGSSDPGSNPGGGTFFPLLFLAFLAYFSFTNMGICSLFALVNFFVSALLQGLYLVTKKFFFKNVSALPP